MAIRFLLWDNDGVLVDTEEGYYLATRRALGEIGIELDLATLPSPSRARRHFVDAGRRGAVSIPARSTDNGICATTTTSSSSARETSKSKACTTRLRRWPRRIEWRS